MFWISKGLREFWEIATVLKIALMGMMQGFSTLEVRRQNPKRCEVNGFGPWFGQASWQQSH